MASVVVKFFVSRSIRHESFLTLVSGEKGFNRFAWFPSRSPRRVVAKAVPEHVNRIGVVMPCDTLESLSGREYNRVPVFVKECIEYIEKVSFIFFLISAGDQQVDKWRL